MSVLKIVIKLLGGFLLISVVVNFLSTPYYLKFVHSGGVSAFKFSMCVWAIIFVLFVIFAGVLWENRK